MIWIWVALVALGVGGVVLMLGIVGLTNQMIMLKKTLDIMTMVLLDFHKRINKIDKHPHIPTELQLLIDNVKQKPAKIVKVTKYEKPDSTDIN